MNRELIKAFVIAMIFFGIGVVAAESNLYTFTLRADKVLTDYIGGNATADKVNITGLIIQAGQVLGYYNESSTDALLGAKASQSDLTTHTGNVTGNPHNVTASQIGAANSSHAHSGDNITSGTVSDVRLPSTMSGKTFTGTLTPSGTVDLGTSGAYWNTIYIRYMNGANTPWHSGNDGSGSGLDADTVDGTDSSSLKLLYDSNIRNYVANPTSETTIITLTASEARGMIVAYVDGSCGDNAAIQYAYFKIRDPSNNLENLQGVYHYTGMNQNDRGSGAVTGTSFSIRDSYTAMAVIWVPVDEAGDWKLIGQDGCTATAGVGASGYWIG